MISIFFKKKIIQDVFHINNCSINLLSISKLSKDLNYEIILKKLYFLGSIHQGEHY
jgi:hypothetical protein